MTRTEAINYHDELVATYTETGDDAILKEIAFLEIYLTQTAPLDNGKSERVAELEQEKALFDKFFALPFACLERTSNQLFWNAGCITGKYQVGAYAIGKTPREAIENLFAAYSITEDES